MCGVSMEKHTNYRLGTAVTSGKNWVWVAPIFYGLLFSSGKAMPVLPVQNKQCSILVRQ